MKRALSLIIRTGKRINLQGLSVCLLPKTDNERNHYLRMKIITILYLCLLILVLPVYSQENPKIEVDVLIDRAHENPEVVEKVFHNAEKYYKKGSGYYGEALKYYLRLYPYAPDLSQFLAAFQTKRKKLLLQI